MSASWSGCIVSDLLLLSSDLVAGFVLNLTGRVDLRVSLGVLRPELRLFATFGGRGHIYIGVLGVIFLRRILTVILNFHILPLILGKVVVPLCTM